MESRFLNWNSFRKIFFLSLLLVLSFTGGTACIGGAGPGNSGTPPGDPPFNPPSAASPEVMGPKADNPNIQVMSSKYLRAHATSGKAGDETKLIDPNANPPSLEIPQDGTLKLRIEWSWTGQGWSTGVAGPFARLIHTPDHIPEGEILVSRYRDVQITEPSTEGWNAVFPHLNLSKGQISLKVYVKNIPYDQNSQDWQLAFEPPPLFHPDLGEMGTLNIMQGLGDPYFQNLGQLKVNQTLSSQNQGNAPHSATPVPFQ